MGVRWGWGNGRGVRQRQGRWGEGSDRGVGGWGQRQKRELPEPGSQTCRIGRLSRVGVAREERCAASSEREAQMETLRRVRWEERRGVKAEHRGVWGLRVRGFGDRAGGRPPPST